MKLKTLFTDKSKKFQITEGFSTWATGSVQLIVWGRCDVELSSWVEKAIQCNSLQDAHNLIIKMS